MQLQELIERARAKYRASEQKLAVPNVAYVPSGADYMRPSSLGMCALKHAYDKLGIAPDFPELTPEQSPRLAWLLDHGSYVAPMVQEALLYAAQTEMVEAFQAEVPFMSDEYHIAGRADGVLTVGGVQYVLEIKDTEGVVQRSVGEPKLAYALQVLSYMLVLGISHGFIITVSKWGFNCYEVKSVGAGFIVVDQWDNRYEPGAWFGKDWNTPETLNFDTVKAEIAKLQNYVTLVDSSGLSIATPIPDPLNDPQGFLCFWKADKGTKTRDGIAKPNCPFSGRCHGVHNKDYSIRKVDGRYAFV